MKQIFKIQSATGIIGSCTFDNYEDAAAKARFYTCLSNIPWHVLTLQTKAA